METTTTKEDKGISYIAFFDLDLTLSKAISGRALAKGAFKRGLMKWSDIATGLWYATSYRINLANSVKVMEKMTGWARGIPEEQMNDLCRDVFTRVMEPSIYPAAYDEIKLHKANNAHTVILSSSLYPVCRAVADHMGIDDVICSRLEVENGILTGRPEGKLCQGNEKLVRLSAYCEMNNSSPALAWYYGDAFIDAPALGIVGNPVCVNPDKKLRRIAKEKGWRIYLWK
jgi:HAD superfamily hydrolase (TIGR01490 family)